MDDIFLCLDLNFDITSPLLLMHFRHASLIMYGLPSLVYDNGQSTSLGFFLLNSHLMFSICIVLCWNIIYDLYGTISCFITYLCLFSASSIKKFTYPPLRLFALYNGCKRLTIQYHLFHHYEDTISEC